MPCRGLSCAQPNIGCKLLTFSGRFGNDGCDRHDCYRDHADCAFFVFARITPWHLDEVLKCPLKKRV